MPTFIVTTKDGIEHEIEADHYSDSDFGSREERSFIRFENNPVKDSFVAQFNRDAVVSITKKEG